MISPGRFSSDRLAGGVLYGYRIDETSFAESCVSPVNKCGHDLPAKTLPVGASLEPKAKFGRNTIRIFQRGHAKAFPVVEPPDDERKTCSVLEPALSSRIASGTCSTMAAPMA